MSRSVAIDEYISKVVSISNAFDHDEITSVCDVVARIKRHEGTVFVFGNGGSSGIASHFATDIAKTCSVRALNLVDSGLLTCLANDFGFENWIAESIKRLAQPKDVIFLISSSGESLNMINGAKYAASNGIEVITLSGFESSNRLSKLGRINIWVDSQNYNVVETTHLMFLLSVIEALRGEC